MTTDVSWVKGLTRLNRLALLDVLEDIQNEAQISQEPTIPLMPLGIKYPELFPINSIGARDRYLEMRYKAVQVLEQGRIIGNLQVVQDPYGHRWDSRVSFSADGQTVALALKAIRSTFAHEGLTISRLSARYGSQLLSLALGIALVLAMIHEDWRLWGVVAVLGLLVAAALRLFPRWKGSLRIVTDWAVIVGTLAAIATLLWAVSHTPATP